MDAIEFRELHPQIDTLIQIGEAKRAIELPSVEG